MDQAKRERPAWPLFLIILLLGVCFMLGAGQVAIQLAPSWHLIADVDSNINPNDQLILWRNSGKLVPVGSGILTQPAWADTYLTPGLSDKSIPQIVFEIPASKTPVIATALPTASPEPGLSATPAPTSSAVSPTLIVGPFPSKTSVIPKTSTPKPNPTSIAKTQTPTITETFTRTLTATITPTITITSTATVTTTASITMTPTITLTTTITPTGTETVTPTVTTTETITATTTVTPTLTPTNLPAPGCSGGSGAVNIGPGNGNCYTLPDAGTLDLSPGAFTMDGNTTIIYYEKPSDQPYTFIAMDLVVISVHVVETNTWYPVFNWGSPVTGQSSSIDGYGPGFDNQPIPKSDLYGSSVQTGVQIDVGNPLAAAGVSAPVTIDQVRIFAPPGGDGDGCDVDAIEIWP